MFLVWEKEIMVNWHGWRSFCREQKGTLLPRSSKEIEGGKVLQRTTGWLRLDWRPAGRFCLRLVIFEEPCRPTYRNGTLVNRTRYCQYIYGKGGSIGKRPGREIVACEIELSIVAP